MEEQEKYRLYLNITGLILFVILIILSFIFGLVQVLCAVIFIIFSIFYWAMSTSDNETQIDARSLDYFSLWKSRRMYGAYGNPDYESGQTNNDRYDNLRDWLYGAICEELAWRNPNICVNTDYAEQAADYWAYQTFYNGESINTVLEKI